ncbi:hypothetical protein B0H13DRAFT_329565 [Mycena leptocephala]|nr:hypothetical protein B0H13DRAFT_329565 [Mycena leptocephala]
MMVSSCETIPSTSFNLACKTVSESEEVSFNKTHLETLGRRLDGSPVRDSVTAKLCQILLHMFPLRRTNSKKFHLSILGLKEEFDQSGTFNAGPSTRRVQKFVSMPPGMAEMLEKYSGSQFDLDLWHKWKQNSRTYRLFARAGDKMRGNSCDNTGCYPSRHTTGNDDDKIWRYRVPRCRKLMILLGTVNFLSATGRELLEVVVMITGPP